MPNYTCKEPNFQVSGHDPFRKRTVVTRHATMEAAERSAAHRGRQVDVSVTALRTPSDKGAKA